VAEGLQNPARFLQVEKPKTDNLNFVAGIVCPSGEGAVSGDWIDIYILNGADIPVWSDQDCTNGVTTLAVTDDSYICTAAGASNVNLGLAKETKDRSGDNGLILMKSYQPQAAASGYTAISAALSNVVSLVSVLSAEDISDVSNMASANSAACSSLATDIATESATQSSLITDIALISNTLSAVSDLAAANSNACSAISNMAETNSDVL